MTTTNKNSSAAKNGSAQRKNKFPGSPFPRAAYIAAFFLLMTIATGIGFWGHKMLKQACRADMNALISANRQEMVSPGYILVAPYYSKNFYKEAGEVQLINQRGQAVHRWKTQSPVLSAILKNNGNLLIAMTPPTNVDSYPGGGATGVIQEVDWDGKVLWEYTDSDMTHDFELLPNNMIAYSTWEKAPASFGEQVSGGFIPGGNKDVWTNAIKVVDRDKNIIWRWHMYDYLDPKEYPLNKYTPISDWSHVNSIRYTDNNPITHVPAFLLSLRHVSTVLLIDAKSGAVIWRSPKNMFSMQHDATFLDNGNILVFDNNFLGKQLRPFFWSRVVEINPKTNKIAWQFDGGKAGTEKALLAAAMMGGAQRLPNGNTLITISTSGRILEVKPDLSIVWDYTNYHQDNEGKTYIMFKTIKYDSVGTEWAGKVEGFNQKFLSFMCQAE